MRGRGDPPGDPNHTQAMHYRRNQRGGGGIGQGTHGVRGQRMQKNGGGQKGGGRIGRGEQLRTFSTDCPLTNISRLALCIHVQCTFYR